MWKKSIRATIRKNRNDTKKEGWDTLLSDGSWSSGEEEEMEEKKNVLEEKKSRISDVKTDFIKKKKTDFGENKMKKSISISPKVQRDLEKWKSKGQRRVKRSELMSVSRRLESHGLPPKGSTCLSCGVELTAQNYIEYCEFGKKWQPSKSCELCVKRRLKSQWYEFNARLESTSCRDVHERLLRRGPPIFIRDPQSMPCDHAENEIKMLWRGKIGRKVSSVVSDVPRGENLVDWWANKTTHVWERPKAMYILRSWLRRFLPNEIPAHLELEATNYERSERNKVVSMTGVKSCCVVKKSNRRSKKKTTREAKYRALLMIQEDRRREKLKIQRLQSTVRNGRVLALRALEGNALSESSVLSRTNNVSSSSSSSSKKEEPSSSLSKRVVSPPPILSPLRYKKKNTSPHNHSFSSRKRENNNTTAFIPALCATKTKRTVSKVALMSAAAPSSEMMTRDMMIPKSSGKLWHIRVPKLDGRISPNRHHHHHHHHHTTKKSPSSWRKSYDKVKSDLDRSLRYGNLGYRDEMFRDDHNDHDWYLRIHQGAKSVHTPERTTRRKMNVIF